MSASASPIVFVTNRVCPFAHRAWLALEFHKQAGGLDYEFKSASLSDKPAWFTEIYSKAIGADPTSNGKVPVIQDTDGTILTESTIIAKYIDDKYAAASGVSLDAGSPLERARVQLFVDAVAGPLIGAFYGLLKAQEPDVQTAQAAAFTAAVTKIGAALLEHDSALSEDTKGPFFLGKQLGFAEVLVWPWIRRVSAVTVHRGYTLPAAATADAALARFHEWKAAVDAHPAVAGTFIEGDETYYADAYTAYAKPAAQ